MASLLDLTKGTGDVAQIGDDAYLSKTLKLMEPQQLYTLWERQHWQSQTVDLERDKRDFASLGDEDREQLMWILSAFFVGEERVTTEFSGLVMAYEDEQEEAFLTTQQVDEARHMQFFDRWFREVASLEGDGINDRLARVREALTEPFVKLFDDSLVAAGRRLIADPSDRDAKTDFITTYHWSSRARSLSRASTSCSTSARSGTCYRASRRASRTSPATSTATSPTAPGTCSSAASRTPARRSGCRTR